MVFGDSENDSENLEPAKYSYAMASADDTIKNVASYVAPSNNEEGVLEIMEQLIMHEKSPD